MTASKPYQYRCRECGEEEWTETPHDHLRLYVHCTFPDKGEPWYMDYGVMVPANDAAKAAVPKPRRRVVRRKGQ